MSADLHDALRDQGLVPASEDVRFVACSTDYRQKINAAGEGLCSSDELFEAEGKLEELQAECHRLERDRRSTEQENTKLEERIAFLENQARELRAENTRLTQKLLESESLAE